MKQLKFSFTDTPISGVTTLAFPRGLINFGADFAPISEKPSEVVISNVTADREMPEKFRFSHSSVSNIYANTGIAPSVQAPSTRGTNLLIQLTEVATINDTVDATYRADVPLSSHLVLKIPAIEQVTEEVVLEMIGRLVSGLFETGDTGETRLARLLRGALLPKDI